MLAAIDRRPWTVPAAFFLATVVVFFAARQFGLVLSFTNSSLRPQFYSSVTGSSSSLLGFLIAAVTVLAAFGKRQTSSNGGRVREQALADARTRLVVVLLAAALGMLVTLICASLALASSNSAEPLFALDMLLTAGGAAGVSGLLYGAVGLGLVVAERTL